MAQFSMTCTCGDTMMIDAANRDEAVQKFKDMMTPETIANHMAEKHPGQLMTVAQVHTGIEQQVKAA
jgi:hypothetical protein